MDRTAFDILEELTQREYSISPATEKLRVCLNEVISEYHLDVVSVLAILSRLSSGYVHQAQQITPDPGAKQHLEDHFYELFQAYLILLEANDAKKEAEDMERMEKN